VGKKSSVAFIVLGVLLVLVAVVWWAVLGPSLTKLPSDIDTQMNFEGNLTLYINPETKQPLAAGQEKVLPITVLRTVASLPDLYTSKVAVFDDTAVMTTAGQAGQPQIHRYALDRMTRKCVESTENWSYAPALVLPDRVGSYGPIFPGGLKVGDVVSVFSNDPNKAFDLEVVEKIADYKGTGVTALKIDAARASTEYYPPIAQAVLATGQGLPLEITFAQLSAQLKAQAQELDLDVLIAAVARVASPADLQTLQDMTKQPVKLVYKAESADVVYIEQKTGATVGATLDRTTTMGFDTTGLMSAFAVMGKYATDPTAGPVIAAAMQKATALAQAAPTKVFNQNMTIIPTSEETLAASAKDKIPLLTRVNLWIPLIVLVVGALVLLLGSWLLARSRKAAAGAAATKA
jgi:hypothetical protein